MKAIATNILLVTATLLLIGCNDIDKAEKDANADSIPAASNPEQSELAEQIAGLAAEETDPVAKKFLTDVLPKSSADVQREFVAGRILMSSTPLVDLQEQQKPPKCRVRVICKRLPGPDIGVDYCYTVETGDC